MIKRISHLVILYTFLFGTAIFVQSCCNDEDTITIVGNGTMEIFNSSTNGNVPVEGDITGAFVVFVTPETEISDVTEFGLMNSAYAVSCDFEFANNIQLESLVLTCDKSFELGDLTIEAGTDLLNFDGVVVPSVSNLRLSAEVLITFTNTFTDQAVFEESVHTFTINMSTDDGLDIVNSATAVFRL